MPLCPGQRDIEEATLFLEGTGRVGRQFAGEEALFQSGNDHGGELEALGGMNCHHAHLVGILVCIVAVEVRGEARFLQVVAEKYATALLPVVGHEERYAVEHLLQVLLSRQVLGVVPAEDVVSQSAFYCHVEGECMGIVGSHVPVEVGYHVAEGSELLPCLPLKGLRDGGQFSPPLEGLGEAFQHIPNARARLCCCVEQLADGCVADAAGRLVDDASERFLVVGIGREAEVAEQVLDFLALIERHAGIDVIGYAVPQEAVLYLAALCIGAIEHCYAAIWHSGPMQPLHLAGDDVGLVAVAVGFVADEWSAHFLLAEDALLYLLAVVADEAAGCVHDGLRGAIVALELEESGSGVCLTEVEDIVDVGSAEAVDALGIVAYHADALPLACQEPDDLMLGEVRVLVLIDQHEVEAFLPGVGHVGIAAQQQPGVQQQVVEVHRIRLLQAFLVAAVDVGGQRAMHHAVAFAEFLHRIVSGGEHQSVLCIGDAVLHAGGLIDLFVEVHLADDEFEEAEAVGGVVDGVVRLIAKSLAFYAEDAGEDAMEGAHPEGCCLLGRDKLGYAVAHLAGGLVREGQGQYVPGLHALFQEVGYLVGEDARLAAACSCNDKRGGIVAEHRFALAGIEFFEVQVFI